jgi:hypothetical protein
MKIKIAISLLVALTGCASAPRVPERVFETDLETASFVSTELDGQVAGALAMGVDDHEAVTQRLGIPMAKAHLRSKAACGERWVYSRPTMVNGDPKMRILLVDFDGSGVVCHSVYHDE